MRTRDEQIEGLASRIQRGCPDLELSRTLAKNYVEEIEQRVRAEIERDSERLDWLVGVVQSIHRTSNMPTQWILEFRTKLASFDRDDLRQAIDAAREVG